MNFTTFDAATLCFLKWREDSPNSIIAVRKINPSASNWLTAPCEPARFATLGMVYLSTLGVAAGRRFQDEREDLTQRVRAILPTVTTDRLQAGMKIGFDRVGLPLCSQFDPEIPGLAFSMRRKSSIFCI